jgi:hypothetical protein
MLHVTIESSGHLLMLGMDPPVKMPGSRYYPQISGSEPALAMPRPLQLRANSVSRLRLLRYHVFPSGFVMNTFDKSEARGGPA